MDDTNKAHWIIDDRGFGGQYYKCSSCGESYCDLFDNPGMLDSCPNCGAIIDEDETEYIEPNKKKVNPFTIEVEEYCNGCIHFKPVVERESLYADNNIYTCTNIIKCQFRQMCNHVKEYYENKEIKS